MSEIPVTPKRRAAEETIVKILKSGPEQKFIKESGIISYLENAGIRPLLPDGSTKLKSASHTEWKDLHGEGGWTYTRSLVTSGCFAPNERMRVPFHGAEEILKEVRQERLRVNDMTIKIVYPRGWLVATKNEIEMEMSDKSIVSGKSVKEALQILIDQANDCWKLESGDHILFVEEGQSASGANSDDGIHVIKAFGPEEEADVIRANSSYGSLKRLLDQLLLDQMEGKEMPVERTVGGVILPFYFIPACHLLCNTVLVSPKCFGRGAGGKPDMAARVGTPRTSLHAPIIWVADAKYEGTFKLKTGPTQTDDVVDDKGKPSSVAVQMAHYVQPTLQWFIIHYIEEEKKKSKDPNTNWFDQKPALPGWMRIYGLTYTRTSVQVWVYYPCYRIVEGKVHWGYVCSAIDGWEIRDIFDQDDTRPRLKLAKLLLVMRINAVQLATRLRENPLTQSKEMGALEAMWLSNGQYKSMEELKEAQAKNAKDR